MVRHVVMFELKDFADGRSKSENAMLVLKMLNELPALIPQIKRYECGFNELKSERAWDIVIISDFESYQTLDEYINHPEHKRVAEFIQLVRSGSHTVDYTF